MFTRFDRIHECDGQTDGQTDGWDGHRTTAWPRLCMLIHRVATKFKSVGCALTLCACCVH